MREIHIFREKGERHWQARVHHGGRCALHMVGFRSSVRAYKWAKDRKRELEAHSVRVV